jgi:hypothetical protein
MMQNHKAGGKLFVDYAGDTVPITNPETGEVWQAPDTPRRRLAERQPQVTIFGDVYQLKAEVVTIGGLPAHAGQNFLVEYARSSRETLRQIILAHAKQLPPRL